MNYTYDPILVFVSVLVAIAGAYACFDLIIRVQRSNEPRRQQWLALAALAIGGSIWAMHFIAMLAVQIPSVMQHDILVTLVSGLVSILMTAAALAIVSSKTIRFKRIAIAGTVMGAGIAVMHYVGMSGMRGHFTLSYDTGWIITSVLVGIFASTLSLWLVMALQLRGVLRRLLSATVMGLSIAGVHYSAMSGTHFKPLATVAEFTQPILSPFSLGLITALVTFLILGWSLIMLIPTHSAEKSSANAPSNLQQLQTNIPTPNAANLLPAADIINPSDILKTAASVVDNSAMQNGSLALESDAADVGLQEHPVDVKAEKIPVQRNKKTYFIGTAQIASISADGHYTTVRTNDGHSHFCNIGFNKLLNMHALERFIQVHRSHAINLNYVVSFQRKRDSAVLTLGDDEHAVPVSRSNVPTIINALGLSK